jgi:hypothetical protein
MAPEARTVRDLGVTALVLGFFGSAWFGWGSGDAPAGWEPLMTAGSVLALASAAAGAALAFAARRTGSVVRDPATGRRYGIIVGIEFGTAFAGAAVLGALGQAAYVAPWIAFVVGVHFVPLAPVLHDGSLVPLGVAVAAVAVAAAVVGLATAVAPSFVTGVGVGALLLAAAVRSLVLAGLSRRRRE